MDRVVRNHQPHFIRRRCFDLDVSAAGAKRIGGRGVQLGIEQRPHRVCDVLGRKGRSIGKRQPLPQFDDVREIQKQLKAQGVKLELEADEKTKGPASLMLTDPDGNPILIDQHI